MPRASPGVSRCAACQTLWGEKEREPSSGRGQQQCSHHGWLVFTVQNPGAILDQKRLPLLMASSPAHDPQSPIIILS